MSTITLQALEEGLGDDARRRAAPALSAPARPRTARRATRGLRHALVQYRMYGLIDLDFWL